MTVGEPDGDGHSSSLALLSWLMMTMMVMMMPVFATHRHATKEKAENERRRVDVGMKDG